MSVHLGGGDLPLLIHNGGEGNTEEEKWESFFTAAVSAKLLNQSVVDKLSDELAVIETVPEAVELMMQQINSYLLGIKAGENDMMRVHSLVGRPELNGHIAMVAGKIEPATGRVPVNVIDFDHVAAIGVKMKPSNLVKTVIATDELIPMLEDQARRFELHGMAAEAVALHLNVGCLDVNRDAWKPLLARLPPAPLFMQRLYERLAQHRPKLEAREAHEFHGEPCNPGELSAFVEGLDTLFCVHLVSMGLAALEAGQQAFYDFANGKQAVGLALSRSAYGEGDLRVAFFKHVGYSVDILIGGRLLDGDTLASMYTNLGRSYLRRVCTPHFPLRNEQMVTALALAINERGAAVATPGSAPYIRCHRVVADLLHKKFDLATDDVSAGGAQLLHRAIAHADKALVYLTSEDGSIANFASTRLNAATCAKKLIEADPKQEATHRQVATAHVKAVLQQITRQGAPDLWASAHGTMVRIVYEQISRDVRRGTYERTMSYEAAEHAREALLGYEACRAAANAADEDDEDFAVMQVEELALRLTFARLLLIGCEGAGGFPAVAPLEKEFRQEAVDLLVGMQALPDASIDLLKIAKELLQVGQKSLAAAAPTAAASSVAVS